MATNKFAAKSKALGLQRMEKALKTNASVLDLKSDVVIDNPLNDGFSMDDVEELAGVMKKDGFMGAIEVCTLSDGRYEIISGHRRRKAWCDILGHETIPALVVPRPKSSVDRFRLHFNANKQTRVKDAHYWCCEIRNAEQALEEDGFSGAGKEKIQAMEQALGISEAQIYRYKAFAQLSEPLRLLEKRGVSPLTLALARGLTEKEQACVAETLVLLAEEDGTIDVSRPQFSALVEKVRKGKTEKVPSVKKDTYMDKLAKDMETFLSRIKASTSPRVDASQKTMVRELIQKTRERLDELETKLN